MNSRVARTTPMRRCLAGAFFLSILCLSPTGCEKKPLAQLDRFKAIEPLEFTNQRNQTFSLGDLKGKVWVASFIFTSCSIECAYLVERLQRIQDKLVEYEDFSLVSFSLDPQTDTPERLTAYAERYCGDIGQWQFLTGDAGRLDRVINRTFLPPGMKGGQEESPSKIIGPVHRNHFAVVDKQGVIRFYVDGLLPEAEELVVDAVQQLFAEPGR